MDFLNLQKNRFRISLLLAVATGLLTSCGQQPATSAANATSQAATAPALPPPQQPAAPAPAPPNPQQRKAQELIAQVERSFSSGQEHYRAGQLTRAKADFDNAVDMMLSSGMDLKTDPLLSDEFNRILDAVNALEMEALKQGNGFAPNVEPAPVDVANDVTFEVDPNIVAKAKSEIATTKSDIPLVINDYVATYINFFANTQKGHNTLKHSLARSGRYKQMIQRVMTEEGVPQDLIYLAIAESGFQPQAVNGRSGAGGMWQFMPNDKYYGLAKNAYVDERFDPEKSTRASARYMKFIYNQLGDWYLAMAGYNWGTGRVQQAVQKTGYADFWELYKRNNLPEQTKNYVPEIIAAIIIAKNPTQYGFDDLAFDPPISYDTIPVNYAVDLRLVSDIVGAQPQDLAALNPSLLRMTTPPAGMMPEPFNLHIPAGTATLFQQRIAEIPEDRRTSWRYHRVTADDSMASVARSFHVSVDQLATANELHATDSLDDVEDLVIPQPLPAAVSSHAEVYKARRGDTLVTIADRFGVSLEDLHRWNHAAGTSVLAGQKIRVAEPVRLAPRTRNHKRSTASTAAHAPSHASNNTGNTAVSKNKRVASAKAHASVSPHTAGTSNVAKAQRKNKKNKNIQK